MTGDEYCVYSTFRGAACIIVMIGVVGVFFWSWHGHQPRRTKTTVPVKPDSSPVRLERCVAPQRLFLCQYAKSLDNECCYCQHRQQTYLALFGVAHACSWLRLSCRIVSYHPPKK